MLILDLGDCVVPSAALRAGLPTTAKQKPWVKPRAKYYHWQGQWSVLEKWRLEESSWFYLDVGA